MCIPKYLGYTNSIALEHSTLVLQIQRELKKEVGKDHEYLYILLDAVKDRERKRRQERARAEQERQGQGRFSKANASISVM